MTPAHPHFAEHGSFADLKLGRKPVRRDPRTLTLEKYLDPNVLPSIPTEADFVSAVHDWPMYDNDKLGDCTIAAAGHMIEAWSAAAGAVKVPLLSDVDLMYWETGDPPATSGDAGGATDDGRDELSVLNYWRQTGLGGDRIGAYVSIDPTNQDHVEAGIYLFGGVYTGIALPQTAQGQQVWDVTGDPADENGPAYPGSWGGHAVPFEVYDPSGVELVTWGGVVRATWRFVATYCEEVYALISPDFLTADKSPAGFDTEQLQADLAALSQ